MGMSEMSGRDAHGVWVVNKRFKTSLNSFLAKVEKIDEKERSLAERLEELDRKKIQCAETHGNVAAKDDDVLEINAGGKTIRARRAVLTQLKGTKLEWIFSGRWEKKLRKDKDGSFFLDVDPDSFQTIVDYLNALAISSEDNPPEFPRCETECSKCCGHDDNQIKQYVELFGLPKHILLGKEMPDSEITKDIASAKVLRQWLSEDGSDGKFHLLYRSSRDSLGAWPFHLNCDGKGPTVTIVETEGDLVVGGYSNIPWSDSGNYEKANKAFIFCLSGGNVTATKMKLISSDGEAVEHRSDYGPIFGCCGCDFITVCDSKITIDFGDGDGSDDIAYNCPSNCASLNGEYKIKNMEVFKVDNDCRCTVSVPSELETEKEDDDILDAVEEKVEGLKQTERRISTLEEKFEKEIQFIDLFSGCDKNDVVVLDVSGTIMNTRRSTLGVIDESVLARQFDDTVWKKQCSKGKPIEEWTPCDVQAWLNSVDGIPNGAVEKFKQNEVNGKQILLLGRDGLERIIGNQRIGAVCQLHDEICKIQNVQEKVFIEHSPYCFGKILDFLRLKRYHSLGLVTEPNLPVVPESTRDIFERVVCYYFPGETAKLILG